MNRLWGNVRNFAACGRSTCYPQTLRRSCTACSSGLALQYLLEHHIVAIEPVIGLAQAGDGSTGMQHRGVVAVAECLADLGQAHLCEVLGERHGHLPRPGNVAAAPFRVHVRYLDLEV